MLAVVECPALAFERGCKPRARASEDRPDAIASLSDRTPYAPIRIHVLEEGDSPAAAPETSGGRSRTRVGRAADDTCRRQMLIVLPSCSPSWKAETGSAPHSQARKSTMPSSSGARLASPCDMCYPQRGQHASRDLPPEVSGAAPGESPSSGTCIRTGASSIRPSEKRWHREDPRMRALEAYTSLKRKGRALDYGKH